MSALAVTLEGLTKRFGDVIANDRITLQITAGTVHGIVGENGAGKSTLLNMLFGLYRPDAGTIKIAGKPAVFQSPADAMQAGIGMVHQHFMLVDPYTVLENVALGLTAHGGLKALLARTRQTLTALMQEHGFALDLDTPVEQLTVGERQQVEILKALFGGADILILDEPTAVLTPLECDRLFSLMRGLKSAGKTILFVTHKLDEIIGETDAVTVIRAGRCVWEGATGSTGAEALAQAMVGSKIVREVARTDTPRGTEPVLELRSVSARASHGRGGLKAVSLSVQAGEVLGIAGVAGNGQTELLDVTTGLRQVTAGDVFFDGEPVNTADRITPADILRQKGLAHVPEDRLKDGCVAEMTATENAVLGYHRKSDFGSGPWLDLAAVDAAAHDYFERQDVRPRNPALEFGAFSGGNQQKLVFAREIAAGPSLMVIGQPTRGVDIGAAMKIRDQITALRNTGTAILLVSADLEELMELADRIAVFHEGSIVGTVASGTADEKTLGLMMAGQAREGAA